MALLAPLPGTPPPANVSNQKWRRAIKAKVDNTYTLNQYNGEELVLAKLSAPISDLKMVKRNLSSGRKDALAYSTKLRAGSQGAAKQFELRLSSNYPIRGAAAAAKLIQSNDQAGFSKYQFPKDPYYPVLTGKDPEKGSGTSLFIFNKTHPFDKTNYTPLDAYELTGVATEINGYDMVAFDLNQDINQRINKIILADSLKQLN